MDVMDQYESLVPHKLGKEDSQNNKGKLKTPQPPRTPDISHPKDDEEQIIEQLVGKCTSPPPLLGSCRLSLAIMILLGNCNMYMMRVNVSVAIVCMVNQTEVNGYTDNNVNSTFGFKGNGSNIKSESTCSLRDNIIQSGSEGGEYSWDKSTQGRILGSFFLGYICTQIIGGFLSTRFGGKRVFGWSMFICALLALLTPIAARSNVYLFITFRFMTGLCQGVVFPAQQSLFAKWNPPMERSRLASLGYAGAHIGYVIAFPIAALLCEYGFEGGWPSIFYVCGIVGTCWFLLWMYFVYDSPRHHPRISEAERKFLRAQLEEIHFSHKKVVPWLRLLTSCPLWAIVFAHICCNWGEYTFSTNIPTYMKEVLKFNIQTNGFLSALPYVGLSVMTNASGHMADYLRRRRLLTTNQVRKVFNTVGSILPAIFVIGTGYLGCENSVYAVVLLTMGVTTMGCQYGSGFLINTIDIAPNFAGIIFGISNTFATLPGFFSPYAIGELTQNKSREEWQTVFFITSAMYLAGAAVFIIFGSGYRQDWDPKESTKDIDLSNSIELANNL